MSRYSSRTPFQLLVLISIAVPLAFSTWQALLNNFAIEKAAFTGAEIGILQSLREVPGFLAFTAVWLLLFFKEQKLALASLFLLGAGVAVTGYFPTEIGLYCTTVIMSIGFHYLETLKQSLSLQWLNRDEAPQLLGKLISVGAITSLITYGAIWLTLKSWHWPFEWVYLVTGSLAMLLVLYMWFAFPQFGTPTLQHKKLVLRQRYWLFYALIFMSGARRQIFVVFAGFMMVEKFGYSAADISLLFLINYGFNWLFAQKIGAWIGRVGERTALTLEYLGLILVFGGYAFVENAHVAAGLYVVDHLFFAMAIAIKTYFQKIADPADIAASSGVSFTINHIAAVVIPASFGLIWLVSPSAVFIIGAAMAVLSLLLARNIPMQPAQGNEVVRGRRFCTLQAETKAQG